MFLLHENLQMINTQVWISNMTIVFSKFSPKVSQKTFLEPSLKFSVLYETLKFHKFQSDDFKHDNGLLKLLPNNTQVRHYSLKYQDITFLIKNSHFKKYDHMIFKFLPEKPK